MPRLWVGGYSADMGGGAEGVTAVSTDAAGLPAVTGVAARLASPSFIAVHPTLPVVYAVGESTRTVQALQVADEALLPLGAPQPAGEAVCHLAVAPGGRFAVAPCWGSGQVVVYGLDDSGAIVSRTEATSAADPYAGVPESEMVAPLPDHAPRGSRAHYAQFLPDGRVLTTDLGYDLVRVWRYDEAAGSLDLDHEVTLPYGTGPRHAAVRADGHVYVVTEYAVTVVVLALGSDGRYHVIDETNARAAGRQDGEAAAHLSLNESGSMLYATVRGSDRVAVLSVSPDGTTVTPLADVASGGHWPRHHLLLGDRLHVANQLSDEITTFALDAQGLPERVVGRLPIPAPTAIVPA